MRSVILFGAGQIGQMTARLLGTDYQLIGFADNYPGKWGTFFQGIPVFSPQEIISKEPDLVCLCVLDAERQTQMRRQLLNLGYSGALIDPSCLKTFDARSAVMRLLSEQIHEYEISGSVAELGVFQGDFSVQIHNAFPDRILHLFDTFEGFPSRDVSVEQAHSYSRARPGDFSGTSEAAVLSRMKDPERIRIHKGYFPETFSEVTEETFAFVSLDADLYAPTKAALPLFYDALSPGGVLLIHDVTSTQFTGCHIAVKEFCKERRLFPDPVPDLHGSAILRKQ